MEPDQVYFVGLVEAKKGCLAVLGMAFRSQGVRRPDMGLDGLDRWT